MIAPAGTVSVKTSLKPCLAELLRTCVHPRSLVLRVEHLFGKAHTGLRGNAVHGGQKKEPEYTSDGDSDNEPDANNRDLHSEGQEPSPTPPWSLRLVLSDGQLQLQAVLAKHLHTSKELLELQQGDVIRVKKFEVRTASRLNGKGRVVYLGVQDCELVGKDHGVVEADQEDRLELEEGSFLRDKNDEMSPKNPARVEGQSMKAEYRSWSRKRGLEAKQGGAGQFKSQHKTLQDLQEDDSDDDGAFDTLAVSQSQVEKRRETLRQIQEASATEKKPTSRLAPLEEYSQAEAQASLVAPSSSSLGPLQTKETDDGMQGKHNSYEASEASPAPPQPDLLRAPPSGPQPQPHPDPPPRPPAPHLPINTGGQVNTLASLLTAPSQKSYPCPPILALISWISPSLIHRPNTPFPPKRHMKIHDPSISNRHSGITVAVFVDAARFLPTVGTVTLLRGLVMQRVRNGEDVILNRYPVKVGSSSREGVDGMGANNGGEGEEEWFISDEAKLIEMGFDVHGLKKWWVERSAARTERVKVER